MSKQSIKRFLAKFYYPIKKGQVVLNYHTVPEDFDKQMAIVAKQKNIQITFDDGFEDNFYKALPVLKKYNLKAIFFISTAFIGKKFLIGVYRGLRMMNKKQIKKLHKQGMIIGCHGHSHLSFSEKQDIRKSQKILENILKEKINLFAYPFGQKRNFNQEMKKNLKKLGFQKAYTTLWGFNYENTDCFALQRMQIASEDTIEDFKSKINGKWNFIKWFQ